MFSIKRLNSVLFGLLLLLFCLSSKANIGRGALTGYGGPMFSDSPNYPTTANRNNENQPGINLFGSTLNELDSDVVAMGDVICTLEYYLKSPPADQECLSKSPSHTARIIASALLSKYFNEDSSSYEAMEPFKKSYAQMIDEYSGFDEIIANFVSLNSASEELPDRKKIDKKLMKQFRLTARIYAIASRLEFLAEEEQKLLETKGQDPQSSKRAQVYNEFVKLFEIQFVRLINHALNKSNLGQQAQEVLLNFMASLLSPHDGIPDQTLSHLIARIPNQEFINFLQNLSRIKDNEIANNFFKTGMATGTLFLFGGLVIFVEIIRQFFMADGHISSTDMYITGAAVLGNSTVGYWTGRLLQKVLGDNSNDYRSFLSIPPRVLEDFTTRYQSLTKNKPTQLQCSKLL